MPNPKPLVTAALICNDVIIGTDGVPTIVRIIDRVTFGLPTEIPPGIQAAIQLTAFFAVKAGELQGDHEFAILMRTPDGKSLPASEKWKVHFDGGETGGNLKLQLGLAANPGLYWLDLVWMGKV